MNSREWGLQGEEHQSSTYSSRNLKPFNFQPNFSPSQCATTDIVILDFQISSLYPLLYFSLCLLNLQSLGHPAPFDLLGWTTSWFRSSSTRQVLISCVAILCTCFIFSTSLPHVGGQNCIVFSKACWNDNNASLSLTRHASVIAVIFFVAAFH